MKITKSEWDAFWAALGPDWYMDDHDVDPEDDTVLKPGDIITLSMGAIGWQGKGEPKPNTIVRSRDIHCGQDSGGSYYRIGLSLPAAIKRWQTAQTTLTLGVEIPKGKEVELVAWLKAHGGKRL